MTGVVLAGEERDGRASRSSQAVRSAVSDGEYAETLDAVLGAIEHGAPLDDSGAEELDRVIGIALQSGRVRALYGPGGEQAALRAYRKLPSGSELDRVAVRSPSALRALAGPAARERHGRPRSGRARSRCRSLPAARRSRSVSTGRARGWRASGC